MWQGLVTIDDVDIRYNGAKLTSAEGRSSLYTTVVHEGTPSVKARNCTDYAFVHERTVVLHAYDTSSGKTTQPATFNRGDDWGPSWIPATALSAPKWLIARLTCCHPDFLWCGQTVSTSGSALTLPGPWTSRATTVISTSAR